MEFKQSKLKGVFEITPTLHGDERGHFFESYNKQEFIKNGIDIDFVQDNQSLSVKGVIRGLHFQSPPYAQDKLVRVLHGAVIDVVLDIRRNSPTYGEFDTFCIDAEKKNMVLIPKGFAHGFATLQNNTIFAYKCSNFYNKASENGVLWNSLPINWQIESPIISEKDKLLQNFATFKTPFI